MKAEEDVLYLLTISNGIGYLVLFIFAVLWARLVLMAVEEAVKPRKEFLHKFVHSLPDPPKRVKIDDGANRGNQDPRNAVVAQPSGW